VVERREKCWDGSIGTTVPGLVITLLELHWRRGDVGGRATPLEEKVKMVLESREKFLGWVTRGEESESDVRVGVTLEVRLNRFEKS